MTLLRALPLLMVPLLGGCIAGDQQLPSFSHSPGFFVSFHRMVEDSKSLGPVDKQASALRSGFALHAKNGPSFDEAYAAGPTWDKVRSFLDIGLIAGDVMAPIEGSSQNRVDIFLDAADRVHRSDFVAITAWNQQALDMGFAEETIEHTGEIVWESLYLVLSESEHAERQVHVEKGNWVDGYWTRAKGHYKNLWMDGYNETIWREGSCRDEYVGTECSSYWVPEACYDVWVDDGYYDTYCSAYDEDGNCVEWTEEWVSTGYYETQCDPGYYQEECVDVYQTVCDPGQWIDVWIDGRYVPNAWIPGDLEWVEGHVADAPADLTVVFVPEEAAILAQGIEYVASFGPEWVKGDCLTRLDDAVAAYTIDPPETSIKTSRDAILYCISPH